MNYDPLHAEPCFLQVQLCHRGPLVAGRIWRPCTCTINGPAWTAETNEEFQPHHWQDSCDRYPPLVAEVHGTDVETPKLWRTVCSTKNDILLDDCYGHAAHVVEERMWKYLVDLAEWAALPGNEEQPSNHPWRPILTSQVAMDTADRSDRKYHDLNRIKPIFGE